jgi:hypothetical protein
VVEGREGGVEPVVQFQVQPVEVRHWVEGDERLVLIRVALLLG